MKNFFIWGLFFVLLSTFSLTLNAEITSLNSAINISGRQRMLSQRILKSYSMIGIKVDVIRAKSSMLADIALFEAQLAELIAFAPNKYAQDALAEVTRLWKPYKQLVTSGVSVDKGMELLSMSSKLLLATQEVVLLLEDLSRTKQGRLVNIAGRQRMLSQRMSMLYMYQTWGFDNAKIRNQLMQDENEFNGALSQLSEASINNDELKQLLKQGYTEWRLFKHGLNGEQEKPIPYIVNLAGNKLLKTMNAATELYASLRLEQ